MNEDFLPICVDDYPGDEEFDPVILPDSLDLRNTNPNELTLARYKLWQNGQELRINFLDGNAALHERVEAHANQWLEYVNLIFNFGNHSDAEIRITFNGNKYSSLVGTDCSRQPDPIPTMVLGGFTEFTDDELMQRVVLHEFGHAIGCFHEQASPNIEIAWNEPAVYDYYWKQYHWNKDRVDRNVLTRYSHAVAIATEHDPQSIMQYPVRNEHTIGDCEIGWNNELSDTDKIFIANMYPYP